MHESGINKFKGDERRFKDTLPFYFEGSYPGDKEILSKKPGLNDNEFYHNTLLNKPNVNFLWFKEGWEMCYMHNISEANSIPVLKELSKYNKLFLSTYSEGVTDPIELIECVYHGTIINAEFLHDINSDEHIFKRIRKLLSENTQIPLYAYPILAHVRFIIDNTPRDGKAKAYNFAENVYISGYTVNGDKYSYEEYGHLGEQAWVGFTGPIDKVSQTYHVNHIISIEDMIDQYNLFYKKHNDVIETYKKLHDKIGSYTIAV